MQFSWINASRRWKQLSNTIRLNERPLPIATSPRPTRTNNRSTLSIFFSLFVSSMVATGVIVAVIAVIFAIAILQYNNYINNGKQSTSGDVDVTTTSQPLDDSWTEATEIVAGLFVGSARAANDITTLRRKGIDAVLSAGTKFGADMYSQASRRDRGAPCCHGERCA
jgi:H+/Cl- antiporter ClcA